MDEIKDDVRYATVYNCVNLNVRDSYDGVIVDRIPAGTRVIILDLDGPWSKICYTDIDGDEKAGFVRTEYLDRS